MSQTKPNFKLLYLAMLTMAIAILLAACQQASKVDQNPANPDRPRVTKKTPLEEVLPTLSITQKASTNTPVTPNEFKLRSQTSRYLNANKSALEITLSDSRQGFCKNEAPDLLDGESIIKISIKAKDGKSAIPKGVLTADKFDLSVQKMTKYGDAQTETKFAANEIPLFKITDINNSIARGNFKLDNSTTMIEGEFFTAVCK
jgi:hypothetical protein